MLTTDRAGRFIRSSAMTMVLLFTVCVSVPMAIYLGNQREFTVSVADILSVYLPYILFLAACFGAVGAAMPRHGFQRYVGVIAALAVLTWIQGNLLVWDYGPLDGRSIPWLDGVWKGVADLSLWILVLVLAYGHSRFRRLVTQVAVAALLIQLVAALITVIPQADKLLFRTSPENEAAGREALLRFSPETNVLHIVMDGFQSDIFSEILSGPENSDLKSNLSGFTFYRDNMGVFPYTQMTIPALLSGKIYQNHKPAEEFLTETLRGKTILNAVAEHGYEVDIAASAGLKNVYSLGRHTHTYAIAASSHATHADYVAVDSARLIDLTLFRVVPHFAKALVHRDNLWVFQTKDMTADYLQMRYFADLQFLKQIRDEMTADRAVPVYKMLHLMLSHRPTVGNQDCEFDGIHATSREAVLRQSTCGLIHVLDVLDRMKELGIYDKSLIILMADHGAWVPAAGITGLADTAGRPASAVSAGTVGMAIPLLAIKAPGESGALEVSDAPTSVVDLPATIASILGLPVTFDGLPVHENTPETVRQRRHLTYAYGKNGENEHYYHAMREYIVDGSPFDATAWRATRLFSPEGEVENLIAE